MLCFTPQNEVFYRINNELTPFSWGTEEDVEHLAGSAPMFGELVEFIC